MGNSLKIPFYLFLCGVFALFVVLLRQPSKTTYSVTEVLGSNSNLTLFIEPDDGKSPLLDRINKSQSEILSEVYLLSSQKIIDSLTEVTRKNVSVKVMLEEHPFGGNNLNQKTKTLLENAGISFSWASSSFPLTHEKMMMFDGKTACILNMNLTQTAFEKNREYNLCSENLEDVSEIKNIFAADWERKNYQSTAKNLVVSPDNSRPKLTAFINSAQRQLDLEMEVLTDTQMTDILCQKAQKITVRIIVPDFRKVDNSVTVSKLKSCGAATKTLSVPYPHAKLIVADLIRAYVGSINFSAQSLDRNRELGILVSQPDILERLNTTFQKDWGNGVLTRN
jgi:phosphatidylserine/phosphatidylglycerophosphate/cardiolipin synthase-like enzyme